MEAVRLSPAAERRRVESASSKCLPYAEKDVEVPEGFESILLSDGKHRWIEVISHVDPHWANGSLVAQSSAHGMRKIVEVAARSSGRDLALLAMLLAQLTLRPAMLLALRLIVLLALRLILSPQLLSHYPDAGQPGPSTSRSSQ